MDKYTSEHDPAEIEKKSLAIIEEEIPEPRPYRDLQWQIVRRMIHASADFDLLQLVRFHPEAAQRGLSCLKQGVRIFTDVEMTKVGITSARMKALGCSVECYLNHAQTAEEAQKKKMSRTAAAVLKACPELDGQIYVVGNAPTALLELLRLTEVGGCVPGLIVGMPVGFVDAARSKELLQEQDKVPYITVQGRKGGSSLAASCVNALAEMALNQLQQST